MIRLRLGRKKVKKLQKVLRGVHCYLRLLMLGGVLSMAAPARADLPVPSNLPVPCGAGCAANGGPTGWVTAGQASSYSADKTLYVNQQSDKAILNWQSFNIGAGYGVQFNQPNSGSVALNRIYQADPSRIQGSLMANGQIYLINRNGFVFGSGAKVDVNTLTASTLNISDNVFNNIGIMQAVNQGKPAFEKDGPMGSVVIDAGAELHSADGGRIMILAPTIENSGKIGTPNGQTILAASQDKVWLLASDDPSVRGLLVEVGTGGDVRNLGEILATRGNITMMGFAVNQDGLVSATTTVNSNGSIKLVARDAGHVRQDTSKYVLEGMTTERNGEAAKVEFGNGSRTEILPELDDLRTAVDEQKQVLSQIDVVAKDIHLHDGAEIVVPGGNVNLTATANPATAAATGTARNGSRVVLESGSLIDVSGTTSTVLPMSRNELEIELRANELKDSPLQRNGVLRGKKVTIDTRKSTKIADISGALATIKRDIGERLADGGAVNVASEGDVVMASGATVDISGGVVNYDAGWMNTTKLVSEGKVYDISDADPNLIYDGVLGEYTRKDAKWGMTQTWTIGGPIAQGSYEEAYTEGKSAGTFNVTTSALQLDGKVQADVTRGKYQRDAAHLPGLGTLSVNLAKLGQGGIKYDPATVTFASPTNNVVDAKQPLDPSAEITIDPRLLKEGGIGRLILNHNGAVNVSEGTAITLPVGGELKISGSEINVDGSITVPAGTVSLNSVQTQGTVNRPITLGEHGRIDVNGLWVNDYALTNDTAGTEVQLINGGSVALGAQGDLTLAAGSVINADGGAYVDVKGKLHTGNGGKITLSSRVALEQGSDLTLGGDIHAFGTGKGGTIGIEANALRIGQSGSSAHNELLLTPAFFQKGGFNSYSLTSNLDGITVAADTVVKPRVSTLVLEGDYFRRATGSDISQFSTAKQLPDDRRSSVDLNLKLNQKAATNVRPAHFDIESGARIEMDPEAKLTLLSDHSIDVNGVLSAPAGQIELHIFSPLNSASDVFYQPEQGIHLGSSAQLLATGDTKFTPNTLDLPIGDVLPGGMIRLTADRGYIVAEAGSLLDVSGTTAAVYVRPQAAADGGALRTINSDAGVIKLTAAESMVLAGAFNGHAGGAGAAGGELFIAMDANNRAVPDVPPPAPYVDFTYAPSTVTFTTSSDKVPGNWQPGTALPLSKRGQAVVSSDVVEQGGFDSLALMASDQVLRDGVTTVRGQINLESVNLDLKRSIILDAPLLKNSGGDSHLAAAYIALGGNTAREAITPKADQGTGQLEITGQHIDLLGNVTLQGWKQTHLSSKGDIRLLGLLPAGGGTEWHGSLNSLSDIELQAAQIYPVTLTQYDITVIGHDGNLKISPAQGAAPSPVLSAGGRLTLKADNIYQGGVVKAPMGDIELIAANTLVLAQGSLTSTSADGQIVPFGRTELGLDWVYPVDDATKLVFGQNADVPTQNLSLRAPSVIEEAGANIDVSGGGDLYAYEFVPGPGGSSDTLAMENAADSYAVLPSVHGYGPYDPLEFKGTDLKPGDSIHLAAGSALPEGDYLLLPARYALLPGAFLVTKQAGTQDFGSDLAVKQTDGSVLVGGYRTVTGTDIREARWSGYTVASSTLARMRSEYQDSFANDFFARRAAAAEQPRPLLPQDAGRVSIGVTKELQLDGELTAAAGKGRGARVDLEATNLTIVSQRSADDSTVQVTAANLNDLGAESILIGGHRAEGSAAVDLVTTASKVTVASGVQVDVPELLLAATDDVTVKTGSQLRASGQGAAVGTNYTVHGDGALLQVSAGAPAEVKRVGATGLKGDLHVEAGTILTATQSMLLESTHDTVVQGKLDMQGGNLSLNAKHISLGDALTGTSGLVLTQEQLSSLQVDHLNLNSRESVDLYGDVNLNLKELTMSAAGLVGFGTDATIATIAANKLQLQNATSSTVASVAGAGQLVIKSDDLLLGEGKFTIEGFSSTDISASRQISTAGTVDRSQASDKTLSVDGDLTLRTPIIIAKSGSDTAIAVNGKLNVMTLPAAQAADTAGLGARLSFEGSDVTLGTAIQLPSGDVRLTANSGDVHLISGAAIDVSGRTEQFSDKTVATPAGNVALQADSGDVILDSGATVALRSVGGADPGTLKVSATSGQFILSGTVDAHNDSGAGDGIAKLDVATLADFSALNHALSDAGFGGKQDLRLRHGDLIVGSDDTVAAKQVHFTADDGAIEVFGHVDAAAEKGGDVVLEAKDDVHLHDTARIDARATGANEAGGHVVLATTEGNVAIDAADDPTAAVIDVSGTRSGADANLEYVGGKVEIRAPRIGDGVAVSSLAGHIRGAESISVEAFRAYQASVIDSSLQAKVNADTTAYMSHAAAITASLNMTSDGRFHLRPGVEIDSSSNLIVNDAWDFAARDYDGASLWRFDNEPGVLTLRAANQLVFNQGVNDGIETANIRIYPDDPYSEMPVPGRLMDGDSWGFRFAGGADLHSADPLAVTEGAGLVKLGEGVQLHTGSGDINIASGNNLEFADTGSAIFSAGRSAGYGSLPLDWMAYLFSGVYPVRGGDVTLNVTGDIKGAGTNQLVSDWLHRMGNFGDNGGIIPTAWAVNFKDINDQPMFNQNVGVFGGGSLKISAGGDIDKLSAVVPTTGRPDGQYSGSFDTGFSTNKVTVLGGDGTLDVRAGGNINGGIFFVDGGDGHIKTGESFQADNQNQAPILAVGDAGLKIEARKNVTIETVLNPTVLPLSSRQKELWSDLESNFFTYAENSSVQLQSLSGDVTLRNNELVTSDQYPSLFFNSYQSFLTTVYPGDLNVAALDGNIFVDGSFKLFPSHKGNLALLANGNISLHDHVSSQVNVNMSDADTALLPGTQIPRGDGSLADIVPRLDFGAVTLNHAATPMHSGDNVPIYVVARHGNLTGSSNGRVLAFYLPKQARLTAGRDIRDILLSGQNVATTDETEIKAGRDIAYSNIRNQSGQLVGSSAGVMVAGPGDLTLIAGRDVDLGAAGGVVTTGNTLNRSLAESGANITVEAGVGKELNYAAYVAHYAQLGASHRAEIAETIRSVTGKQDINDDETITMLGSLSQETQRKIALTHYYNELTQSALEAAKGEAVGYQRGYDAIVTLLGDQSYSGDVRLYFSRIHTVDGGDINMLVPGGLINAGLAATEGFTKKPSELGIVAQRSGDVNVYLDKDMLVNQSRVFALDGGDIAIWSQEGNIDAGRGAKSALSAPPPIVTFDDTGNMKVEFPAAISGSGIRSAATTEGVNPGSVTLAAPHGVVIANDAGIDSAGALVVAATAVLGADNISAGGGSVGVPSIEPPSVPAGLANAGNAAGNANNGGQDLAGATQSATPLADSALAFLEVEVLGFGAPGTELAGSAPPADVAVGDDDAGKRKQEDKGNRLAKEKDDGLPTAAEKEAEPAGRVAATPAQ